MKQQFGRCVKFFLLIAIATRVMHGTNKFNEQLWYGIMLGNMPVTVMFYKVW